MSIIAKTYHLSLAQRFLFAIQKRFSTRESIHRYVEPHKFKKHMLAACEPYIKRKYQLPEEACKGTLNEPINLLPLERILVNELLEDINKSNFILFIQYNYTKFQDDRVYRNTITKTGGKFHALNNKVYKETFKILKREEVYDLFITRNALITGQAEALSGCVKALRKMPQFLLLCGYVDDYLYDVEQLKLISVDTNIDQCRANLLSILETPAIDLSSSIERYYEMIKSVKDGEESIQKSDQQNPDQ